MTLALRSKILKCTLGPLTAVISSKYSLFKNAVPTHKDQTKSLSIAVIHSGRKEKKNAAEKNGQVVKQTSISS